MAVSEAWVEKSGKKGPFSGVKVGPFVQEAAVVGGGEILEAKSSYVNDLIGKYYELKLKEKMSNL